MADSTIKLLRNTFPGYAPKKDVNLFVTGYLLLVILPAINAISGLAWGGGYALLSFLPGLAVMIFSARHYPGNHDVVESIGGGVITSLLGAVLFYMAHKLFFLSLSLWHLNP
ncbi:MULTISPECIES: hypothetical protein [Halomonas]|uniref:hypothetical protein n=1 Tax=Halomonas TaxID=2745 RepID=UPI003CFB2306